MTTSVEVNREPVGVTFDESIVIVDGQLVVGTTEGSSILIDGEDVPVTCERDKEIHTLGVTRGISGKPACSPESIVTRNERVEGSGTDGDEHAGLGDATEEAISEAVLTTSVEINGEPVGVTFDESIALVDSQLAIGTTEGSRIVIDEEEVPVTVEGDKGTHLMAHLRK